MTAALEIDRQAAVDHRDLGAGSWVDVVSGFVVDADRALATLRDGTPWEQSEVLRYDRYIPERRLTAGLRADTLPLLRQTSMHLEATYRVPFSGVAAILYRDGGDFQGLHSDREMRWLEDTRIAIVVLGQRRPFVLRRRTGNASFVDRTPAGAQAGDIVLMPGEGDLVVMGGACQADWLHGIPACDTPNPRISLTWRWTSRRGRPDTNPTFYDGRQFSDAPRQRGWRNQP